MAKSIGKITAKVIIGDEMSEIMVAAAQARAKNETYSFPRFEAMRIQGRVDKSVVKPSALNPDNVDVRLSGEFICINVKTGEAYHSATLYPMGTGMTELMAQAEPGSMFAMRVFLAPSSKTVQGYTFDFESAIEIKASEAVQRLGDAFAALPAPGKAEGKGEVKAEAKTAAKGK